MEFHPVANIFPLLEGDELRALADDIAANGQHEPIWLHRDGRIVDGRNRFRACEAAGVDPHFREFEGDDSELVPFVVSLNLHRRHLSSGQQAAAGVEADELMKRFEREAQDALREAGRKHGRGMSSEDSWHSAGLAAEKPSQRIDEAIDVNDRRSTAKVAKLFNTNRQYVSDAKKIKADAPDVFAEVRSGAISLPQAKEAAKLEPEKRAEVLDLVKTGKAKNVKKAIKQIKVEERRQRRAELDGISVGDDGEAREKHEVKPGDWWTLGRHRLYCGDTGNDGAFLDGFDDSAAMAFADPPYNSLTAVDEWDTGFEWDHDWLTDIADIAIVTPGQNAIQDFMKRTKMPFRWPLACWIRNGGARGALGHANWIFAGIFAQEDVSLYRNAQDFRDITIGGSADTGHRGKKPDAFMSWLIDLWTKEGDIIVDPFLGSGTTLLLCEQLNRVCIGGELDPAYCSRIIARWEAMTGEEAKRDA